MAKQPVLQPYSLNCEFWGPGFIFPYLAGRNAFEVHLFSIKEVANYFPFMTIKFRKKCSALLKGRLENMNMLTTEGKVDPVKFLQFVVNE